MIYLKNTTESQTVYIPRNRGERTALRLTLFSQMDKRAIYDGAVENVGKHSLYFAVSFALQAKQSEGEYSYTLYSGKTAVAQGIAVIGDYERENPQYDRKREYEQYQRR